MRRSQVRLAARIASYPRYTGPSNTPGPLTLRPVLPTNLRNPDRSSPPPHPARPELPPPPPGISRSVHATPAAYPRQLAGASGSLERLSHPFRKQEPPAKESKEERNARLAAEKDECVASEQGKLLDVEEAKALGERAQWVVTERWRRDKPSPDGLTLILTHACGLDKSHWAPVVQSLLSRDPESQDGQFGTGEKLSKPTNVVINDVWLVDDIHHGASVDVNAGRLGTSHTWVDFGRDVISLTENILPEIKDDAPWELEWHEAQKPPRVVLIGHSYGGSSLVHAAHTRPELFEALFLAEPMVTPALVNDPAKNYPLTLGALKRRSEWASREDAAASRTNPMFKTWDEETFKIWLGHSVVPVDPAKPDGAVTLATPTWAEAATFSEPYSPPGGWHKLPELTMPVGFFMAADPVWMGGEKVANEMMVQEQPKATADAIWRFLTTLQAEA